MPCRGMLAAKGETMLFPLRVAAVWHRGAQKHSAPMEVPSASPQGKAGICFGALRQDEQQPTGENQGMLVGEGVVKAMTESCRNPRESLEQSPSWCSLSLALA